ncbi:alpha/beta hydrolase [Robertkochia sediminum]|uniref:alpha/beta hydrolase n=1 Tax=Robertkochia sediminum TaxID=2785326 RepID=UPI001931A396|nr:alpha/beta hydrolase-fold protein [Robertkochia sediminum]MBL7473248.1 alpha/beta hydrolase [Robertkochia sediminum]
MNKKEILCKKALKLPGLKIAAILLVLIAVSCQGPVDKKEGKEALEGTFRLRSAVLNEERTCLFKLPGSYREDPHKRYPVLILLDGGVHYTTTLKALDSLNATAKGTGPEMIVIAIENVDRERDFTVTKIKTKRENTMGGGKRFLDFIEKELIPIVDEQYRTKPQRIFVGHSLGGLLGVNAFMDEKRIFEGYICMDPSIWWDEEVLEVKVAAIHPEAFRKKLYIATANQGEAKKGKNKDRHEMLYRSMQEQSAFPSNIKWQYFQEEDHRSIPRVAIYEGLKFLYPEQQ